MTKILFYSATALLLLSATAQAEVASVNGTSWDLSGKFSTKVKVKCQRGGGSSKAPTNAPKTLTGHIEFFDDTADTDSYTGTFTWTDNWLNSGRVAQGHWEQQGARINLTFDDIYASPLALYGQTLQQGFSMLSHFSGSSNGIYAEGSAGNLQISKQKLTGNMVAGGRQLLLSEQLGVSFDASASAMGQSNTCSYKLDFARTYKGTPAN